MKKIFENSTKVYGVIGKCLCALAGGAIGFIYWGSFLILPSILIGFLVAHYLEKSVVNPYLK